MLRRPAQGLEHDARPRAGHQPLEVDARPFEPVGLALEPLHLGGAALPQLAQLALALRQCAARCRQLSGKALVCVFGGRLLRRGSLLERVDSHGTDGTSRR